MENKKSNYVRILREICREEGILLHSYSGDWAFQLEKDGKRAFIVGYQFGLNLSSVQQVCTDKNIASEILRQAGVPCVFHQIYMAPRMQSYLGADGNWETLLGELKKYGKLVCKDNYGTGGNQVYLVRNAGELENAAAQIFQVSRAMAVCPYEEIRDEYRLVLLDGEIRLAFVKRRPCLTGDGTSPVARLLADYLAGGEGAGMTLPSAAELKRVPKKGEPFLLGWKHNLGQGAKAERLSAETLRPEVRALGEAVYRALGIRFASVDVIHCAEGFKVLEVNSGVMMEHFAGTCEAYYREAKEIYRSAIRRMLDGTAVL